MDVCMDVWTGGGFYPAVKQIISCVQAGEQPLQRQRDGAAGKPAECQRLPGPEDQVRLRGGASVPTGKLLNQKKFHQMTK